MERRKNTIGRLEHIALPGLGIDRVEAKIDTGAYRSAMHYQRVRLRTVEGVKQLVVTFQMGGRRRTKAFKNYKRVTVKSLLIKFYAPVTAHISMCRLFYTKVNL